MGAINREWHADHPMPPKATEDQRGKWHSEHVEACGCRAPSVKEQELIARGRASRSSASE